MQIWKWLPMIVALSLLALPVVAQEGGDEPQDEPKKEEGPSLKELKAELKKAINAQDERAVEEVLYKYRTLGGMRAMRSLLAVVPKIPLPMTKVYWQVINGAAAFEDEAALRELGNTILENKSKALARDLMFGLRNNRSRNVIHLHAQILAKGNSDLQQMAVDQLADIRLVESVDTIIDAMRNKTIKSSVMWWATRALEILTGGANLGDDGERWYEWWQYQRPKGLPKLEEREETGLVTDTLDPIRKYEFKFLKKMPLGQVIVINTQCKRGACDFDNIEDLLARMEIPHKVVKREDFEKPTTSLKGVMAIIVNCTQIKPHCICPKCKPGGTKKDRLYR